MKDGVRAAYERAPQSFAGDGCCVGGCLYSCLIRVAVVQK